MTDPNFYDAEYGRRWRLILGAAADEGSSQPSGQPQPALSPQDAGLDQALSELYGDSQQGGTEKAKPDLARWLDDVRRYFPESVAEVLRQDARQRRDWQKLLLQPEFLSQVEPDIHLVHQLLALKQTMPTRTRETARQVVQQVVDELTQRLENKLRQAIVGSLDRATRRLRPRHKEINWSRTIYRNLKHYQPSLQTIIPETLVGYGHKRQALHDVILCLDQSGSMLSSVVYASIFGAVMASIPALSTALIAFSTAVVDLTDQLDDPVGLLFGLQLRGGTDINRALAYARQKVTRPQQTTLILISDLFEGGDKEGMLGHAAALVQSGVHVIVLLALNDSGIPRYDHHLATELAHLGIPTFACTPDQFPDLMASALCGRESTPRVR